MSDSGVLGSFSESRLHVTPRPHILGLLLYPNELCILRIAMQLLHNQIIWEGRNLDGGGVYFCASIHNPEVTRVNGRKNPPEAQYCQAISFQNLVLQALMPSTSLPQQANGGARILYYSIEGGDSLSTLRTPSPHRFTCSRDLYTALYSTARDTIVKARDQVAKIYHTCSVLSMATVSSIPRSFLSCTNS